MRGNKLSVVLFLVSFITSSFIGLNLRGVNDGKEAVELLVPYYFWVLVYTILSIIVFVFWTIKDEAYLISIPCFFLSLVVLVIVPFVFTADQRYAEYEARQHAIKREHERYLVDLQKLNSSIQLNPELSAHYLERSRLKRSHGRWKEALRDAELAISLEKTMEGYWELGWCHEYLGNLDEAARAYQSAHAMDSIAEWPKVRLEVVNRRISEENRCINDGTK